MKSTEPRASSGTAGQRFSSMGFSAIGCSANGARRESLVWTTPFGSLVHSGVFRLACALHARFVDGEPCSQFRDLLADALFGFGGAWLR
jgi:hypothetical protein